MKQASHTLAIDTNGPGLIDITPQIRRWAAGQGIVTGLLTLWCQSALNSFQGTASKSFQLVIGFLAAGSGA
jgi:thiamine phosphate synthase YjbQ (UPF0047 family)